MWWISPVPGPPLFLEFGTKEEAAAALHALAMYDDYQISQGYADDSLSNAGGLQVWEDNDWEDVEEDDE